MKMFRHLQDTGIGYWPHFARSMGFALLLWKHSLMAACHAVYPDVFTDSTSRLAETLPAELTKKS